MNDTSLVDWAAVEADYRAGAHSLRTIAGAHHVAESTIRKRAAKHRWVRTLPGAQSGSAPGAHSMPDGARQPEDVVRTSVEKVRTPPAHSEVHSKTDLPTCAPATGAHSIQSGGAHPMASDIQGGAHLMRGDGAHLIQDGAQTSAHDTLRTAEQVSASVATVSPSPDLETVTAGANSTGENTNTGCSLGADPAREQQRTRAPLTLEMEYQEAQRRRGTHLAGCRLAAGGARCSQCLELSTQRDIAYQRFRHAQYLR